jgi:hypothetical protein
MTDIRLALGEGLPIPAPYYIDGTEDRATLINCALWDVREKEPRATSVRVSEWVDSYLTTWEKLRT